MHYVWCAKNQCLPILLVDKEDRQVSAGVSLLERSVDIFARTMSSLDRVEMRKLREDFSDLVLVNGMFLRQFFDNVGEPNEPSDPQRNLRERISQALTPYQLVKGITGCRPLGIHLLMALPDAQYFLFR